MATIEVVDKSKKSSVASCSSDVDNPKPKVLPKPPSLQVDPMKGVQVGVGISTSIVYSAN